MSLADSYHKLREGFEDRNGMSPRAARWSATAFFVVTALALLIGLVLSLRIAIENPTGRPVVRKAAIISAIGVMLGACIAGLGEKLSPFPHWLKVFATGGFLAGAVIALTMGKAIAGGIIVLSVGIVILVTGLTR